MFFNINQFMNIFPYKPVKTSNNVRKLKKIMIDIIVEHQDLREVMVTIRDLLFTLKFGSLIFYFLGIKHRLSTAFYSQTDVQIEQPNSTMKTYLQAFVNFEQKNSFKLLVIAEFRL